MSRNYTKQASKKPAKGKKALLALGIVLLLVVLFFLSFFVTSLVLKANQEPLLPVASAEPTPKPSYEELEQMVIEKNKEIEELERQLETYRGASGSSQSSSAAKTSQPVQTATAQPTAKPSVAPSAKPTQAATVAPTIAPTKAPTQAPQTAVPTESPSSEAE
ncbi:MAG: hypothetical protein IKL80_06085 [Clostridia bacterium]|nr:hypothetical protein [Clostridia bacterium]